MSAIDPGIEDQIKQNADDVDPNDAQHQLDQEEREDYSVPNRWWFAAVGSPLLAGTFGPMATGFNIMALVSHWRQSVPPPPDGFEVDGHLIDDPPFVLALNAVSLACAVVGNAFLLLNMAKRVKFAIAQPVTIIGFLLGSLFLIADLSALGGAPHYDITNPALKPHDRHALTQAFYYGIFAASLYMILGLLMCWTVYGALRGHFNKQFHLTLSQRSLMLQTMSFIAYLLLGGLVYSHIEGWPYLDSVYWADVTILTVGLGDYSPSTQVGRGLLFPFAMGGILILGLVIGSIRTLVLERGREKMSARMLEKRRAKAVHNVDAKYHRVKISMLQSAPFIVDPNMCAAEKREQEFNIMRKVQKAADSERRYFSLANSGAVAIGLWFIGALVFEHTEYLQGWTYFEALYFSYTSLLTIGYGTPFVPKSNSGKAFFVFWSLLAVPSLTIVISNMGDTIVQWVSSVTNWVSKFTVLPDEKGFRSSLKEATADITDTFNTFFGNFSGPGPFGIGSRTPESKRQDDAECENKMLDRLAERLDRYIDDDERDKHHSSEREDKEEQDIQFYHYVLARECRNLQKNIGKDSSKQYSWADWEYYLKLMGDENDPVDFPGQAHPDIMVPDALIAPKGLRSTDPAWKNKGEVEVGSDTDETNGNEKSTGSESSSSEKGPSDTEGVGGDGNISRAQSVAHEHEAKRKAFHPKSDKNKPTKTPSFLRDWSWMSDESPLLSNKSESDWILERLSAALERELNRQRKGYKTKPPITLKDAQKRVGGEAEKGVSGNSAEGEAEGVQQRNLERAEKGET